MIRVCFHLLAISCITAFLCLLLPSPQEHDEPILKHLQDIKVKFSDPGQPMVSVLHTLNCWNQSVCLLISLLCSQSFTLEFHFEPNDFFTNTVLTKTYKMRSEPDENDPFSFDGPEIMSCTGWVSAILSSLQVFVFETTFDAHNEMLPKSLSVLEFGTSAVTGWWSGAVEWATWQDFESHTIGASTKYLRWVWTLWPRRHNL